MATLSCLSRYIIISLTRRVCYAALPRTVPFVRVTCDASYPNTWPRFTSGIWHVSLVNLGREIDLSRLGEGVPWLESVNCFCHSTLTLVRLECLYRGKKLRIFEKFKQPCFELYVDLLTMVQF